LFFLDLGGGRVLCSNPDGTDLKTLVSEGRRLPDGLVVDVAAGHIYWTNMGDPKANDGSIERADLDGSHRTTIVPAGCTFTPKQLQLDKQHGKIYWSDREGMRVMRSNLDGSDVETLVETGHGEANRLDARNWCVGKGSIAYVTLNRPKVLNALNKALMAELKAAFEDSRDDSAVRGVILTGAGDRAFAAGADISELANDTAVEAEEKSRIGQAVTSLIENLGKPVIAAVKSCASREMLSAHQLECLSGNQLDVGFIVQLRELCL
jgi:Enoyl-CoA hydratase/isomerase